MLKTLLLFCVALPLFAVEVITYSAPRGEDDKRYDYNIALLKEALEVTKEKFGEYELKPSKYGDVSRKRQVALVQEGKMSVVWGPASDELQDILTPIRIPIFKGLLGYRFFFVNSDKKDDFSKIENLDELKKLTMCSGLGWGVTNLYTHHEFKTLVSPAYEGLFEMIDEGRADYFSRGINEIFKEYETRKEKYPKLHIDTHLALYHPLPFYTYTAPTKEGKNLAKRIDEGMQKMIKNGSFDAIFQEYHAHLLANANLATRTMLEIDNPFLPKDVPLENSAYWIDIDSLKRD